MRPFECACGAPVFFENTSCLACGRELGFLPDIGRMGTFDAATGDESLARAPIGVGGSYRKCENYSSAGVCNWMVPADEPEFFCQACRLNDVIPDLSEPQNQRHWASAESAKRRLVYTLNRLKLPVVPKSVDPKGGLAFDIKTDTLEARVLTGHDEGLITLNLNEADPVLREKARLSMHERYRTLLGHFRHEVGHYYWDVLLRDSESLTSYRQLFGDERADYMQALERHYAREPSEDWKGDFVSAYATSHPWEDWAETWAHYLHMVDTLETAHAYGVSSSARPHGAGSASASAFESLLEQWLTLTVILNALSRSMGHEDLYPFEIGDGVRKKLAFVHDVIAARPSIAAPSR
jgi:hypothetical protein